MGFEAHGVARASRIPMLCRMPLKVDRLPGEVVHSARNDDTLCLTSSHLINPRPKVDRLRILKQHVIFRSVMCSNYKAITCISYLSKCPFHLSVMSVWILTSIR